VIKRCIIHFGLHKTGSSSIQQFLRRELTDPAFFYPESGREPHLRDNCHNRVLVAAFCDMPERYHTHAIEGVSFNTLRARGEQFKSQLRTWSRDGSSQTLILSAEELSNFEVGEARAMADFLRSLQWEVSGLGYVRKYKRLQESRFQQALRMPSLKMRLLPPEHDRFARFPYRHKIEKFLQIFGSDAVTVRKFDRSTLEGGCVVRDFCTRIGISQEVPPTKPTNRSLSLNAIRLLYAYRKFGTSAHGDRDLSIRDCLLVEKLSEIEGPRATFHSSLLLRSRDKWEGDVEWVSEFLGENMLGDLYADDSAPCLRSEADLLEFSPRSLEWLASASQTRPSLLKTGDPVLVARSVGLLRDRAVSETAGLAARTRQWFFSSRKHSIRTIE